MSKLRIPSYRLHKAAGQAVVTIAGRDYYLGNHGTRKSREEYERLIAEYRAGHGTLPKPEGELTVAELAAAFVSYARTYYGCKTKHPTGEYANFVYALRPLIALYSRVAVSDFGPLKLQAVRERMIAAGLARTNINRNIHRIRYVFRWGVSREMVAASVPQALDTVTALRYGKCEARETEPVRVVPEAHVDAVLPFVSPVIAAMIGLQRVTGMRSGEVTLMRTCDLDTRGSVWVYVPSTHKTAYRGHERKIYLGPAAQEILRPFLKTDLQAFLFTPAESMEAVFEARSKARVTPLHHGNRPGTNRKRKPRHAPGEHYTPDAYRRAVQYGITRANKARIKAAAAEGIPEKDVALIPVWHPHQLRHNVATNLRREYGIEAARIILGHRSVQMTAGYAEADHTCAISVMEKIG